MNENLKSLFLRINFQQNIPTLKSEKVQEKIGAKLIFAILTLQTILYRNVTAFFLETSIPENMGDSKGRECFLTLLQVNIRLFLR